MARGSQKRSEERFSTGRRHIKRRSRVWVHSATGALLYYEEHEHNLIVASARGLVADLLRGATGATAIRAFAVGSSGTAPIGTDTQLGAEITRLSIPADGTNTALAKNLRAGNIVTIRQSFTGINDTVREYGEFGNIASPPGAANAGTMWNRVLVGPIPMVPAQTITLENTMTFV